jgi:hypothetical protein
MLFGKQIPILGNFIKTFDTSAKLQANYIEPLKHWYDRKTKKPEKPNLIPFDWDDDETLEDMWK